MNIRYSFIAAILPVTLLIGCATKHVVGQKSDPRIAALKRDYMWPAVEAAIRHKVASTEGSNSLLASGYYTPVLHTNGVWAVVVYTAYPDYRQADHINLLAGDNGDIVTYGLVRGRRNRKATQH